MSALMMKAMICVAAGPGTSPCRRPVPHEPTKSPEMSTAALKSGLPETIGTSKMALTPQSND